MATKPEDNPVGFIPGMTTEQRQELLEVLTAAAVLVKDGKVVAANIAAEDLFGGEIVGFMVEDLMPPGRRPGHIDRRTTWLAGTELKRNLRASEQLEIQRLDGADVPVKIGLSRLPDDLVLVEIQDLTEVLERQRKFDRELAAVERRAEIESRTAALQEQTSVIIWGISALFGVVVIFAGLGVMAMWRNVEIDPSAKDVAIIAIGQIVAVIAFQFGTRTAMRIKAGPDGGND